jgi:membrane protease subunit HflK
MPWNDNKGGGGGGWNPGGGGRGPWGQGPGGGGRGPNIRPPDMDEVFRRAREWLKRMFPNQPPGAALAALIGGGVLLLWLWTGIYVIQQQEVGVVTRFGRYAPPLLEPGFHIRFPQPIESVVRQHVQQRETNVGFLRDPNNPAAQPQNVLHESLMLTGDENIVDVDFTVFWIVRDAAEFTFNVLEPEETVKAVAEAAMREVMGQTKFDDAVQEGRVSVEERVKGIMQATLDTYRAGVTITRVNMRKASSPAQVLEAFRDVQAAEQDMSRKVNNAKQYVNTILPRTRGEAAKILQDAEAYKQQQIAEAKGEAQRFISILAQYQGAKLVTRERMFLETMQKVLGSTTKIIVPGGSNAPVVPYLPLPELRRTQPPASPSASGVNPGAAP